jgi:NADH:ubiquinone oxidoreductase subunit K
MMELNLYHILAVGAVMFAIGLFGALTRRNILGILISLELMFNAAMVNFVAFSAFEPASGVLKPSPLHGQVFALFIILVAAAEAVVGLALVLSVYRNIRSVYAEKLSLLKW